MTRIGKSGENAVADPGKFAEGEGNSFTSATGRGFETKEHPWPTG